MNSTKTLLTLTLLLVIVIPSASVADDNPKWRENAINCVDLVTTSLQGKLVIDLGNSVAGVEGRTSLLQFVDTKWGSPVGETLQVILECYYKTKLEQSKGLDIYKRKYDLGGPGIFRAIQTLAKLPKTQIQKLLSRNGLYASELTKAQREEICLDDLTPSLEVAQFLSGIGSVQIYGAAGIESKVPDGIDTYDYVALPSISSSDPVVPNPAEKLQDKPIINLREDRGQIYTLKELLLDVGAESHQFFNIDPVLKDEIIYIRGQFSLQDKINVIQAIGTPLPLQPRIEDDHNKNETRELLRVLLRNCTPAQQAFLTRNLDPGGTIPTSATELSKLGLGETHSMKGVLEGTQLNFYGLYLGIAVTSRFVGGQVDTVSWIGPTPLSTEISPP